MSTHNIHVADATVGNLSRPEKAGRGIFGRMFERFVAARTAQARVHVAAHLARLSDQRLADLGFTPDEVKAVREKGAVPASYWA